VRLRGMMLFGLALVFAAGAALAEDEEVRRANQLITNGDYDAAIELMNGVLHENPGNAEANFVLANAYHRKGDYEQAVKANRQAAATVWAAPTARYNEACALSLMGHVEEAKVALDQAMQAGFLDLDLIAVDADLENLRAKYEIAMPKAQEYVQFKAHNGVELAYKVITPQGYDRSKTYPALVLFPAGNGPRSADWANEQLLGSGDSKDWLVVYPIAPERGWFTHPSHHALNAMLDEVRDSYKIEGNKYYLAGFGSGTRVATTYSQMSHEYFLTLTTFSAWHWDRWDDEDLASGLKMPVRMIVGENDAFGRKINERAEELIGRKGDAEIKIVKSDSHMLASLRHGKLLAYIPHESSLVSGH
jgi:tetratricopeptide (TPR) repeat protein